MTPATADLSAVRKTIQVKCTPEHAFRVFTTGFDTWWPRTHHIGKSPMKEAVLECHVGGRCYSRQEDGTDCDWGSVLTWEPPERLVFSWQITPQWTYESDLGKASEVEVRFTPQPDGSTRVDLEHRNFERIGEGGAPMRASVDSPGGWSLILGLLRDRAESN